MDDRCTAGDSGARQRPRRLPTLEVATSQLMVYLRDPEVSDQRVLSLLQLDVALSSTVLAVANSPFYGLPRRVDSLHQALRILGFDALRSLIYAATIQRLFRQGRICPGFDAKCLWYHASTTGAAARRLALHVGGLDPQQAFLAGLLHDIGHIVEIQMDRDAYCSVLEQRDEAWLPAEVEAFGQDHAALGAEALRLWRFPDWSVELVAGHHAPVAATRPDAALLRVCQLADSLSGSLPGSFERDLVPEALGACAAALGIAESRLDALRAQVLLECPPI
ncbi:MAG: HDOD domain-containing protein [Gammaproteobacteria bacterium]|nr:MAG: HDOD domain-containing protein [Gammaproteobacteria bacterium]